MAIFRIEHQDGNGNILDIEEFEVESLGLDPQAVLINGLIDRAGDLWDALVAMPDSDPAKAAVEIITDVALTAALPLVE